MFAIQWARVPNMKKQLFLQLTLFNRVEPSFEIQQGKSQLMVSPELARFISECQSPHRLVQVLPSSPKYQAINFTNSTFLFHQVVESKSYHFNRDITISISAPLPSSASFSCYLAQELFYLYLYPYSWFFSIYHPTKKHGEKALN